MTRDELVDQVEQYAKRTDLTAEILSIFLPQAEARIGRDLKSNENDIVLPLPGVASPFDLPDDYGQIRALQVEQDRGPRTLKSVDLHTINNHSQQGTAARIYVIAARQVITRPATAGDFTLFYWNRPSLPDGTSENDVLDRWPNVYLFGTLAELHIFERDQENAATTRGLFDNEVARINKDAGRARGDKPAMRRA